MKMQRISTTARFIESFFRLKLGFAFTWNCKASQLTIWKLPIKSKLHFEYPFLPPISHHVSIATHILLKVLIKGHPPSVAAPPQYFAAPEPRREPGFLEGCLVLLLPIGRVLLRPNMALAYAERHYYFNVYCGSHQSTYISWPLRTGSSLSSFLAQSRVNEIPNSTHNVLTFDLEAVFPVAAREVFERHVLILSVPY
ncbi:hypothetical protein L6164_036427 [Bauhinia variegata]|uniref:Uncharacterized protein n=1 Tax=Bauhinia variegata TaxID=167791 RepID=A0ACB9KH60_BAUVA|nr:hypothetical protein L6164_036427 [Bauhinia variegata]